MAENGIKPGPKKGFIQSPEHVQRRVENTRETYAQGKGKPRGRKRRNS